MDVKNIYSPGPGMGRMELTRAYVPFQNYTDNYNPEVALMKGTFFPELWRPYRPGKI
ncbi:MAG: spore coat associated protein CotJA [Halanaerobiales bacterium]